MSNERIAAAIVETARTVFKQADLEYDPALPFRSLRNFDSVRAVQFILATEKAFGVEIAEDEVDRMFTLGDVMEILLAKDLSAFVG
jgi:acyl carrier protein